MESEGDVEFLGNDNDMVIGEIDWDVLLEGANALDALELELENPVVPAIGSSSSSSSSSTVEDAPANPSPDSLSSWIGEIETILMKDDGDANKVVASAEEPSNQLYQDFLADILVESPSTDAPTDVDSNACADSEKEKVDGSPLNDHVDADADADDPTSKKRRRQLRNKDAALRSRERRKVYVKDLEMKSNYFEAECRRLGRLLQTCYAENHALRLSLQMRNAYGVSATKQESAVLLLELLLLGSLLWLVDIMCPLALPLMALLLNRGRVPRDNQGRKALKGVGPREAGSKMFGHLVLQSFVKSRRCKASRTKMKQSFLFLEFLYKLALPPTLTVEAFSTLMLPGRALSSILSRSPLCFEL